jgi:HEAT repeats
MTFSGINFSPSPDAGAPNVQVHLNAEQPIILTGNVEDSDMRGVLTYVVENGERFDAGARLDCLEALKAASRDQQVRRALIAAARKDQNAAVRMKAVESLRDAASDADVRQALLDALEHDANPGVRVEAVNVLVGSLQHGGAAENAPAPEVATQLIKPPSPQLDPSVERVVQVLQQLQRRDPSRYVRLRSAAALRQIGPREAQ